MKVRIKVEFTVNFHKPKQIPRFTHLHDVELIRKTIINTFPDDLVWWKKAIYVELSKNL